jgi:hypothetical protein
LENKVTVSSKTTPSKPIRKSLRQNMVRNINVYNKHVKKHMKEYNYMKALSALREGRNTNNPAHKDAFNSLISDLKKKNPHWDRKSVGDHDSTTRAQFTEENTDGEI